MQGAGNNGAARLRTLRVVMSEALTQFFWSLQALAQPAEVQAALFPSFVVVADELALDLKQWLEVVRASKEVPEEAVRIAQQIDAMLCDASSDEQFWTLEALASNAVWQQIRDLSIEALGAARVGIEAQPLGRAIYVPSRHT